MKQMLCIALVSAVGAALIGCKALPESPRGNTAPELGNVVKPTEDELVVSRAKAATELAAGWFQQGQNATALEELANAVKIAPNFAPAYGLYGLVHHTLREDGKAQEAFAKALALAPEDPGIRLNYGWFLCRTQRELESITEFEKAADNPLYRTPELALQYAAQCATRVNRMAVAETFYKRMAALAPDSAVPVNGLVEITYRVGRYNDTRNHLRNAMRNPLAPANILHIGFCAETRLGDKAGAASYLTQLQNRFPSSVELVRARAGECD
jgi:type IV pilus assembly protein PilF